MGRCRRIYSQPFGKVFEDVIATGQPRVLFKAFQKVVTTGEPPELYEVFMNAFNNVIEKTPQEQRDRDAYRAATRIKDAVVAIERQRLNVS